MKSKEKFSNLHTPREVFDTNIDTIDRKLDYSPNLLNSIDSKNVVPSLKVINNTENRITTSNKEKDSPDTQGKNKIIGPLDAKQKENSRDSGNAFGQILKLLVLITILIQYMTYVILVEIKGLTIHNVVFVSLRLFIFHIFFVLMIGSLYATIRTNPGTIPIYWGFYIGDDDFKKKRYCLLCQVFKPDRTHHCSICNICVLNMDHHCPWINSCIGFYNRKFFVQLLFYFFIVVFYLDFAYIPTIQKYCTLLYQSRHSKNYLLFLNAAFIFFNYTIVLGLTVLNNCTTIESLDEDFMKNNKYNLNKQKNWEQVFGKNKLFWFIPILHEKAYPDGDGLNWPVNHLADRINKKINENKSTSTNLSFLKQITYHSNHSTSANNYSTNNTQQNRDPNQIMEMADKE